MLSLQVHYTRKFWHLAFEIVLRAEKHKIRNKMSMPFKTKSSKFSIEKVTYTTQYPATEVRLHYKGSAVIHRQSYIGIHRLMSMIELFADHNNR